MCTTKHPWTFLMFLLFMLNGGAVSDETNIKKDPVNTLITAPVNAIQESECVVVDNLCLSEEEVSSYEAIKSLHKLLDDDMSGEIDMNESVDFLKEELTITDGYRSRQKNLHHNSDRYISVSDLWRMWKSSEVHNWTVEQTVNWLQETVGLPQYSEAIIHNNINGSHLPRLTMNKSSYLVNVLGIKGLSHRTKLTVKAMDAVLFGPPKGSHLKDLLIAGLVAVIVLGVTYIGFRKRMMAEYHSKLILQIEELQQEEIKYKEQLQTIKQKTSHQHPSSPSTDVPDSGVGVDGFSDDNSSSHTDVVGGVTGDGGSADNTNKSKGFDFDDDSNRGSVTPSGSSLENVDKESLKFWLKKTYQKERHTLEEKSKQAQSRMDEAKEVCKKLRVQGKNPFNLFSLMHGKIDNFEKTIYLARASMLEVQSDEKELETRWSEIERLLECDFRVEVELQSMLGSYTNLQQQMQNSAASDTSNIAQQQHPSTSSITNSSSTITDLPSFGGGVSRGGTIRTTAPPIPPVRSHHHHHQNPASVLHHAASFTTGEYSHSHAENSDADTVSLPRSSSVGNSTIVTNRLPSSMSHAQLSDCADEGSSGESAPNKKPRRQKSVMSKSQVPNGDVERNEGAMFSMGGSPLVTPTRSKSSSTEATTGSSKNVTSIEGTQAKVSSQALADDDAIIKEKVLPTVSAANSSSLQSSKSAVVNSEKQSKTPSSLNFQTESTTAAGDNSSLSSFHRELSQSSMSPTSPTTPNSSFTLPASSEKTKSSKKKNFFGRFTGSRKSLTKKIKSNGSSNGSQ